MGSDKELLSLSGSFPYRSPCVYLDKPNGKVQIIIKRMCYWMLEMHSSFQKQNMETFSDITPVALPISAMLPCFDTPLSSHSRESGSRPSGTSFLQKKQHVC